LRHGTQSKANLLKTRLHAPSRTYCPLA
jgi:hypothetical protein